MAYEIAIKNADGSFDHLADTDIKAQAVLQARVHGDGDYGGSSDRDGGQYEDAFRVVDGAIFELQGGTWVGLDAERLARENLVYLLLHKQD